MATVLIVDDDKFTRSVLQTAFAQDPAFADLDVETQAAINGREALFKFRELTPDVVIVDLLMPEVDGFTLCRNIRDAADNADVHILCMSGIYRDRNVVQRVKDEFAAEFFAKPYQLRDLTKHVATLLELDARGEDSRSIKIALPEAASEVLSGDLSQRPLPAVLFDLLHAQATGRLHLKRRRVRKTVELMVGHPRSVTSTARDETLGHFLVTFGALTEEQHKIAVRQAAKTKRKLADVLIALKYLTPEQMIARLTALTSYKLMQSLRWPDGQWRFEPIDAQRGPRGGNPIDMITVVLQGLRHTASRDTVPERVVDIEHNPLAFTQRGQELMPAIRQHLSERLVDCFHEGDTVRDLVQKGVERSELFMALDALILCDALEAKEPMFSDMVVEAPASRETGEFSIEELSELVHSRRLDGFASGAQGSGSSPGIGTGPLPGVGAGEELFDTLFDDVSIAPMSSELPIELPDDSPDVLDSGVFASFQEQSQSQPGAPTVEETNFARRMLLKEYLRIQGLDHYELLKVDAGAPAPDIATALSDRKSKLSLKWFSRFDLGRDYAKLEQIHAFYEEAGKVLLDAGARAAYNKSLGANDEESPEPTLDAEIAFHAGCDLLQHGNFEGAINHFKSAIGAAPDEAEYHAVLGWTIYLQGDRSPRAADDARPHLNQGLLINPDHALSHEYKGIISAELGNDETEAIFHLERALDADANREGALMTLEILWQRRGEYRPLERQYRRLIYRTSGVDSDLELTLWRKLARLYLEQLGEPANARVAFESALRLAPDDAELRTALEHLGVATGDHFSGVAESLQREWSITPSNFEPGLQLMRLARDSERPDAAFCSASALVARGCTEGEAVELYQRYRPRFVVRAQQQMTRDLWSMLRPAQDMTELNDLFAVLDPVIETAFPFDPAELELDALVEVDDADLPEPFVRVRGYVSHMLGIDQPRVVARPDYGHQIHVGAVVPPVLIAGDDVITSPERLELAFRLGRAMAYLLPGHTFAGSRPTRLLKAAVLAVFSTVHRGLRLDDPQGHIAQVTTYLDILSPEDLAEAQRLVIEITRKSPSLNLSLWSQALGRTANRIGLLLCGDLPLSVRFARDGSPPAVIDDLIDFATSQTYWSLRNHLGLSIDV